MVKKEEESREFRERRQLQEGDKEVAQFKHNLKMEQLAYERETNKLFHDWSLERERIKRAEARKDFREKKSFGGYRN